MIELDIIALGAVTPVGLSASQTALLLRAKVRPVHEVPFRDALGESLGACFVPMFPDDMVGDERLVALAAPALREVMTYPPVAQKLPLVLAVGHATDAMPRELLETASAAGIDASAITVLRAGHAGFGYALREAARRIEGGAVEVVVGAIDSHCEPFSLRKLDEEFAVLSRRSPNGFVPSEAAIFIRVKKAGVHPASMATIKSVAIGVEETVKAGEPNLAAALTELVHASSQGTPMRWLVSDVNGEPHRSREVTLVETRCPEVIARDGEHLALGCTLGDVGAASMGLATVLVSSLAHADVAPSLPALVIGASETGERAVLVIDRGRPDATA